MIKNKRFKSVVEMAKETLEDKEFVKDVEQRIAGRQLIKLLIALRVKKDVSQGDLAAKIKWKTSQVSKFEHSSDVDITPRDLVKYVEALAAFE